MPSRAGRIAVLILVFVLGFAAAPAAAPAPAIERLLYSSADPQTLRERLADHARRTSDVTEAASAHLYRGESFARAAEADSAIACFRLSEAGGSREGRIALADALLRRRTGDDVAEATSLLESALAGAEASADPAITGYQARLGWAKHLEGNSTAAAARLAPLASGLSADPMWRYRLSRIAFGAGDTRAAYDLMRPLLVATRRQDPELETMLGAIGREAGRQRLIADDVAQAIGEHDALEAEVLKSLRARRVRFPAGDGEYVSAVLLEQPERRRPVPAIVVLAPGDSIADYDSLATALHRAGYAVMLVEPRGTGWSVSANCPSPDTWVGREDLLQSRVARDVVNALESLGKEMPLDTLRALVVGVGAMAPVAVRAADLERRITALALVSPAAAWVDRGAFLNRLRRMQRPLFLQVGAEDRAGQAFLDSLYQTAPPRESRVSESRKIGSGVRQFGGESGTCARLVRWAADATTPRRPSKTASARRGQR